MEVPSHPEPPKEMARDKDIGSSETTIIRTLARKRQPIKRLIQDMMAEVKDNSGKIEGDIFCLEVMYPIREEDENPLLAYKASEDPDTMYMQNIMNNTDKKKLPRQ